ncbi:MAG: hypothetical protein AAFU64_05730, partial [Bacteroidota bacterium]
TKTLKEMLEEGLEYISYNDVVALINLDWPAGLDFIEWMDKNPSYLNNRRYSLFAYALEQIEEAPPSKRWEQIEALALSDGEQLILSRSKRAFYFANLQKAASEGDAKLFKSSLQAYLDEYLLAAPNQYHYVLFQNLDQLLASGNIELASFLFQKEAKRLKELEITEDVFNFYARMLVRYKNYPDGIYLVQAIYTGQYMLDYALEMEDQKSAQRSYSALNTVISEGIKKYPNRINDLSLSLEDWLAKTRNEDKQVKKWLLDNLEILKNYPQKDENNDQ